MSELNHVRLDIHAKDIRTLLASEWEVPGYVRAWHARYRDATGATCQASIRQQKGVEGFSVGLVRAGIVMRETSSAHVNLRAACIWLGLDEVALPLDWHIEL